MAVTVSKVIRDQIKDLFEAQQLLKELTKKVKDLKEILIPLTIEAGNYFDADGYLLTLTFSERFNFNDAKFIAENDIETLKYYKDKKVVSKTLKAQKKAV